jgi:hypothetical protein
MDKETRKSSHPPGKVPIDLGQTLLKLAAEVHGAAAQCRLIQEAFSRLLTELNHPDLRTEIQILQGVDLVQQTLEDISALLQSSAASGFGRDMPHLIGRDIVRLDSFRQRMGLDASAPDQESGEPGQPDGPVDWF